MKFYKTPGYGATDLNPSWGQNLGMALDVETHSAIWVMQRDAGLHDPDILRGMSPSWLY